MLKNYHDAASGSNWRTYYQYDTAGRVIEIAAPSAVTGYNDVQANLAVSFNSSSGLISKTDYYTTTTAGETTAGSVAGFEQDNKIQQGSAGTTITLDATQYFQHTAGGNSVDPVANHTVYRNTNTTGGETTSYSYTWFTGTTLMQSEQVSKPVISSTQNGPGTADVQTTFFDSLGRPIWTKDADGFINYFQYDQATSASTKSITDVDTTKTTDFTGLPTGWTTKAQQNGFRGPEVLHRERVSLASDRWQTILETPSVVRGNHRLLVESQSIENPAYARFWSAVRAAYGERYGPHPFSPNRERDSGDLLAFLSVFSEQSAYEAGFKEFAKEFEPLAPPLRIEVPVYIGFYGEGASVSWIRQHQEIKHEVNTWQVLREDVFPWVPVLGTATQIEEGLYLIKHKDRTGGTISLLLAVPSFAADVTIVGGALNRVANRLGTAGAKAVLRTGVEESVQSGIRLSPSSLLESRSPQELFIEGADAARGQRIAPKHLYRELQRSKIGRETLRLIEKHDINAVLSYQVPIFEQPGFITYGHSYGDTAVAYVSRTQSKLKTAETIIHEVTHSVGARLDPRLARYTQQNEVIARIRALKHTNPNPSLGEIRQIFRDVLELYPELPNR